MRGISGSFLWVLVVACVVVVGKEGGGLRMEGASGESEFKRRLPKFHRYALHVLNNVKPVTISLQSIDE